MPNKRASQRWEHPTYRYAYVREFRGMACTVIHGSFPQTTGLYWKPASKAAAMKILDQRLQAHLHGTPIVQQDGMTCLQLFEQFVEVKGSKTTPRLMAEYARYMKAIVPARLNVKDTLAIRKAVNQRLDASDYSQNSRRQVCKRIRAVFKFGIDQGWLSVNPIHPDMVPAEIVHTPKPYTDEELELALDLLDGRNRTFVAFLMSTGCRAVEAVRLTWDQVHSDHIVIDGKRTRIDRENLRVIPFALCPELPEILQEARQSDWTDEQRVFGVTNYQPIARMLSKALGDNARGFHDIRKWRINKWLRLNWPERALQALAGHDEAISKKHYRTALSASELASIVQDSQTGKGQRKQRQAP